MPAEKVPAVYSMLGQITFLRVVKVNSGDVEKLLTAPQQAAVFETKGALRLKSAGKLESSRPACSLKLSPAYIIKPSWLANVRAPAS